MQLRAADSKRELTMTTIFANARILDGTGAKPYAGDVVVDGYTIVDVLPAGQRRPLVNATPSIARVQR